MLWLDYIREREGKESILFEEKGLLTYMVSGEEFYIVDVFVAKEFRGEKISFKLADIAADLARSIGCKYLTGSIKPSLPGASESMAGQLAYGFKIVSASDDWIVLKKEI